MNFASAIVAFFRHIDLRRTPARQTIAVRFDSWNGRCGAPLLSSNSGAAGCERERERRAQARRATAARRRCGRCRRHVPLRQRLAAVRETTAQRPQRGHRCAVGLRRMRQAPRSRLDSGPDRRPAAPAIPRRTRKRTLIRHRRAKPRGKARERRMPGLTNAATSDSCARKTANGPWEFPMLVKSARVLNHLPNFRRWFP